MWQGVLVVRAALAMQCLGLVASAAQGMGAISLAATHTYALHSSASAVSAQEAYV